MNILVYCPRADSRAAICRHLIDVGHYRQLHVGSERSTVSLVLNDAIDLALLFDPARSKSMSRLKDFIRKKRNCTRVKVLPSKNGQLAEHWRDIVNDGLKPLKPRTRLALRRHPRFQWKPSS